VSESERHLTYPYTAFMVGTPPDTRVRQPRLAEIVAADLRHEILSGDLADGALLPNQDRLCERFGVSKASLREAMRILESEQLISVRRGKHGGVIIHAPSTHAAAFALGLLLQAGEVPMSDFVLALDRIEPLCAEMCALRSDRVEEVLPGLLEPIALLERDVDAEAHLFLHAEQLFHRRIVELCGNATLASVVGVLETLSLSQRKSQIEIAHSHGVGPNTQLRHHCLEAHKTIIEVIARGDGIKVAQSFRWHRTELRSLTSLPYDELITVSVPNSGMLLRDSDARQPDSR
jgi:GntR family transcriptional regulator, transcriptional repressor for pyruvate dehydrogenase complex